MAHIKTGLLRGNISHYEHHNGNKDYMVHKDRRANRFWTIYYVHPTFDPPT